MDINWTAVSAIGTITSSFLGLIALLISLRNKRNEEKRSKPLLSLVPVYAQNSGYFFVYMQNLSHVNIKLVDCKFTFLSLPKSKKVSKFSKHLVKLAEYFPFKLFIVVKKVAISAVDSEKFPGIMNFAIGNMRISENDTLDEHYTKDLPESLEPHGDMNAAIKKTDLLALSDYMSKYGIHQVVKICFTCSNGVSFYSKPIRLDKIAKPPATGGIS